MAKHRAWLRLVIAICLSCVAVTCVLVGFEAIAWQRLGNRLGIEASPSALDEYLHTVITEGMSPEQVHRELDSVGPTKSWPPTSQGDMTCETVFLSIGPIPLLDPGYVICYNLDGELIIFTIKS